MSQLFDFRIFFGAEKLFRSLEARKFDHDDSVSLRLMESVEAAREATRTGVRRLFALQLLQQMKHLSRTLPHFDESALYYSTIGSSDDLKREMIDAIVDRALYLDAPGIDFAQLLPSADGRYLYGINAGAVDGTRPASLLKLDGRTGAVLKRRALPRDSWFMSVAVLPESLIPRGELMTTSCQKRESGDRN